MFTALVRTFLTASMLLSGCYRLLARGPCPIVDNDSKPVSIERQLSEGTTESDILLSALVSGPEDVVEARWASSGSLVCLGLLAGRSIDLHQIGEQLVNAPIQDGRMITHAIVRLRRQRHMEDALLAKVQVKERPCGSEEEPADAIKRGLIHLNALGPRTQLAADCFSYAAMVVPTSLSANLGAARAYALTKNYTRAAEYYERVCRLDPLLTDDTDLELARLPAYAGEYKVSVDRLQDLGKRALSLKTQESLYLALKIYAEDSDQYQVAADAQRSLVLVLKSIRKLAPSLVGDQKWWFENLDLAVRLESFGKFEEANRAYQEAFESASSDRSRFEPDLGRIRIAVKTTGKTGRTAEECRKWKERVSSPTFKIDERNFGGLDLAEARIDFSCGNELRARTRVQKVISKRSSWDEPYRVLGEFLQTRGEQQQAKKVFRLASEIKRARDSKALEAILSEAREILNAIPDR